MKSAAGKNKSGKKLAAPQGFEPQYAGSEPAVLPLNEGAVQGHIQSKSILIEYIGRALFGQSLFARW
jgi:hypothetical protein